MTVRDTRKDNRASLTRRAFYLLTLDWIHLRGSLPRLGSTGVVRRSSSRTYGHPSEWASDKAAEIAYIFRSWHENLSEIRNETAPPSPYASELRRVVSAWKYLEPRFEYLVDLVNQDALDEATALHETIQAALGLNNPKLILPFPCPNRDCGLKTLERDIRIGASGAISCGACGYSTKEENYHFMLRVILDTLIDAS